MGREHVIKLKEIATKLSSQKYVGNKVYEDKSLIKSCMINEEYSTDFQIVCKKEQKKKNDKSYAGAVHGSDRIEKE
jgi:hypothetical protein